MARSGGGGRADSRSQRGWGFPGDQAGSTPAPLRCTGGRDSARLPAAHSVWPGCGGVPGIRTHGSSSIPNIAAAHLQATWSIPLFLPSVRIDGKRYLDGYQPFEKLAGIWAAIEMGATRIIAIDSMPKVGKWWMHLAIDIAYAFKPTRQYPPDLDITIVSPSETLGDTDDAVFWKRANVERWVNMGMRDVKACCIAHYATLKCVLSVVIHMRESKVATAEQREFFCCRDEIHGDFAKSLHQIRCLS